MQQWNSQANNSSSSAGNAHASASPAPRQAAPRQAAPPPPPPPPAAPVSRNPKHKALYDFPPQNPGELGLEKDMVYEILDKNPNGWWLGLRGGIEGWIPSNYLDQTPEPEAPARQAAPPPRPNMANGGASANAQQGDNMARLAAALASRSSPTTASNRASNVPARPGISQFQQQDDESDEEPWD
ncbi:class II myosin [Linderina macrospora]|uniref:Class II myosin n=1 Tax=Linderina macrospora TaxID=4868 RepID=A0ACC1JAU4_9FUNG|nr:class II myosin [Linderina macrospora]